LGVRGAQQAFPVGAGEAQRLNGFSYLRPFKSQIYWIFDRY